MVIDVDLVAYTVLACSTHCSPVEMSSTALTSGGIQRGGGQCGISIILQMVPHSGAQKQTCCLISGSGPVGIVHMQIEISGYLGLIDDGSSMLDKAHCEWHPSV